MAITKNYLKSKAVCKITFDIPAEAEKLAVVGDFNNWDAAANPLKKLKSGNFNFFW